MQAKNSASSIPYEVRLYFNINAAHVSLLHAILKLYNMTIIVENNVLNALTVVVKIQELSH